ncbi:MAG: CPBP family intramembrane metalloprotease [Bacteroidales bacterium]|nr:CPBP family intramembrane metalloprotease [Bacteroidales bacterium]MDD2323283.1 CPBP family intramembrane metalloprotease [Bacteroidales bacterium]MDD3010239.1 CPBP family intramembrane metalloprotease [Bacteroidales bacterium]MDD3962280.1 CPBP family intramembrane metalloprotease [Bacteroidales bacterium]MDY0285584.1 CPBP family intramembrane glutamic endopeptidase [Bacteroidales bacterium]
MEQKNEKRKAILAIAVFYLTALFLRYLTNKTELLSGINNAYLKIILQGVGPAIGALIAIIVFRIKPLMSLKGNFASLLIPLSIYWILPIILLGMVAFFTKGTFPLLAIFTVLIYGLLEEIGWRGFLQQLLASLPKFVAILFITVLWFVWHLNFTPTSATLIFFFILLLGSWGIGLVAEKTNSLIAAAAFHSLNNFFTDFDLQKVVLLAVLIIIWVLSIKYRHQLEKISFRKNTNTSP